MEIRQLKYYVGVVDHGSVSRAAQRLFIAQSALSKQIGDLEQELDVQLLVRARSGVHVTESGKIFYEYAQAILKQIDDARTAVHCAPESIVGSVVLGVPQSALLPLALPLLQAAREQLPQVSLHMNEELTGNLLDQLKQGRVDLAIFTSNISLVDVEFEPIVAEEFFWIRGKDQAPPRASGHVDTGEVTLEEIAAQPLIMSAMQHSHCMRAIIERVFVEHGVAMPPLAAEINSVHILKSAVRVGMAPTILPLALVAPEVEAGHLVAHRIRAEGMQRVLGICASREIPLTKAKQAVATLLADVVRDLARRGAWPGGYAVEAEEHAHAQAEKELPGPLSTSALRERLRKPRVGAG